MAWPTNIANTYTGNSAASIASARSELDASIVAVNNIINSRGVASGIPSLDSSGQVPGNQISPNLTTTSGQDLNLLPSSGRVSVTNLLNLTTQSVAQLNTVATPVSGDIAYCNNGNAGVACLAVYSVNGWKVVSLGTDISAT
tara:strand:- start:101 stop:526 length:426 start_codon:yes stop_codon:yes gene_type:complete